MDEIEYKLKKKNAILVVNAISKLIDAIQCKGLSQSEKIDTDKLPELKFLKEKCEDSDPVISITACQGLVTLVEFGMLGAIPTLSSFISILPSIRTYTGVVPSIGALLVIDMKARIMEKNSYKCLFNLRAPQHPLIIILKKNRDVWFDVLTVMQYITNHTEDIVAQNSLELLRPVFLYVLCDPCVPVHLPEAFRQQVWKLMLEGSFLHGNKELLIEILSWIQVESEAVVVSSSHMFMELIDLTLQKDCIVLSTALVPFTAALTHRLISFGHDPRCSLSALSRLLAVSPDGGSCVLMIFAKTIGVCPVIYMKDLVNFCVSLMEMKISNAIATKMVVCALLPWLVHPSYLTGESLQLASKILARGNESSTWPSYTSRLYGNKLFNHLRNTDSLVGSAAEMCKLAESWQSNPINALQWLRRLTEVPEGINEQLQLFMSALFIHNFEQIEIQQESFKLLLKLVEINKEFAATAITLILYKLAEEKDPVAQLELLRGLTKMAMLKENVNLVLNTLGSMKNEHKMKPLLVDLYVRLWKVESRCYPYLQKLLVENPIDGKDWNFDVARALAIKEICESSPSQHGPELVKLLSQILNQCGGVEGELPSSLALQGITALCKAEIVNVATTWRALAPKLSRDKRPGVITSLCDFFSCILEMEYSGQEYDKLVEEIIIKLWSYITSNKDREVISAAFKALSKAEMEKLSLKTLPESYRQRLQLPSSYAKTPVDAARRPEDVLPYIPCECWIQLLQNVNPEFLDAAGDMLSMWLRSELIMYQISIYRTATARGEPANYSYLPPHSICRGLSDQLRKLSEVTLEPSGLAVARQYVRILGKTYPKPLPPLTWTFLKELIRERELEHYCFTVAIKQAPTSPSARKIIEDYLNSFEPSVENEETVRKLYALLSDLCKGVPPTILAPFVEKSLQLAISISEQEGEEHFSLLNNLLSLTKATLKRDDIHEANRGMLSLVIEGLLGKFDVKNKMFDSYVDCVTELTSKFLERMSSPSVWWEVTPDKLRQSLGIRSALASKADTDVPLVWLNECIEATLDLVGEHTSVLECIAHVLSNIREHETNPRWTVELLGQIQSVINNKPQSDNQQAIIFLCDVFLLTVIILSGYDCLVMSLEYISSSRENRLQLFPQALVMLLNKDKWKSSSIQVMEWLYHMQSFSAIPPLYADVFHRGLMALRHYGYFKTLSVWTRFTSCRYIKLES